ncbi:hypothetical protein [Janthinobacterium sp. UMAB-56]|uniref:hypothetical protein n=1 Tax=Janthinobacterium sp. UMAB-56 TaxID=1365361 RepID=UPI001C58DFC6|nr:hypothetical protein [Janthinobacterium sp. UMAB-56]
MLTTFLIILPLNSNSAKMMPSLNKQQARSTFMLSLPTRISGVRCSAAYLDRLPAELVRIFYNVGCGQLFQPEKPGGCPRPFFTPHTVAHRHRCG